MTMLGQRHKPARAIPLMPSELDRLGFNPKKRHDPERYFAREGVDPLPHAFPEKVAIHPGLSGEMVPPNKVQEFLPSLLEKPLEGKITAYIHVPFCETHCLYCGFYNLGYEKEQSRIYTDSLISELAAWRKTPAQSVAPVHAVYLGGGTPTALEADDLERILNAVREHLPLANDCEITVEGRLHNFGKSKIEACFRGGANRFSLGVQSFHTDIRRSMGRLATREGVLDSLQLLQSYGQAAVVVDLIYGFPRQTMDMWREDLATAQSIGLDGADCYQLNVYSKSPLGKAIQSGSIPAGADLPAQSAMFAASVHSMTEAFFRRLSISHWGRTTRERNLYNQFAKGRSHCLAFGPGAGGSLHGHFYMNTSDYRTWQASVARGEKAVAMMGRPHKLTWLVKAITENLEQSRLDLPALEEEFGVPLAAIWEPLLEQWQRAGLIEREHNVPTLTLAGQFWQVTVSQLLLDYLKHSLED